MKTLLIAVLFCIASAYCDSEEIKLLENITCVDSKVIVEEKPDVTHFKIVTDVGDVLFDVNSKFTNMTDLGRFLGEMGDVIYPRGNSIDRGNSTDYYITKRQTESGLEVMILNKREVTLFRKTIPDQTGSELGDIKCAHVHGLDLNIDQGWDIKNPDGYNMTSLVWSTLFRLKNLAKHLVDGGADVNQECGRGYTPIAAALRSGEDELVEYFIQKGGDVHQVSSFLSLTLLHFAAYLGRANAARMLVEHGLDVNSKDPYGVTPLIIAASENNLKTAEYLLSKGADVNAKDASGRTALHMATLFSNTKLGHKLIEAGADINAKEREGNTPLMLAVDRTEKDDPLLATAVEHWLNEHNPDLTVRNNNGDTILSLANKRGHKRVAELLTAKGAI